MANPGDYRVVAAASLAEKLTTFAATLPSDELLALESMLLRAMDPLDRVRSKGNSSMLLNSSEWTLLRRLSSERSQPGCSVN
jgi:hypothetical protein